jgi:predicted amidohydrolase YtcJ
MNTRHLFGSVLLVALLQGCSGKPADMILHGGKVLTVDSAFTIQSAVAVKDGRILAVGGEELLRDYEAPVKIDLQGRVLMPGFTDTHVHMRTMSQRDIDASKARSIADLQQMLRDKAAQLGPGEWITGYGWDEAQLAEKRNPVRADLDAATPDNPVVLARAGNHSSVGNSLALKIAGIDRRTPDPDSGLIEHDAKGEPNGIIRERADLYRRHVPPPTWDDVKQSYVSLLRGLLSQGITSVINAGGSIDDEPVGAGGTDKPGSGPTYRRVRALCDEMGGQLPRVALYISYPGAERLNAYAHASGYGDECVRLGPIGESGVDGGFTGPTAWTLVDYKGMPGFHGKRQYSDEELQQMVDTAGRKGWQMGLHAIGDAAIVQAVSAYSKTLRGFVGPASDHRWFLNHFTIMPPDDTMRVMAEDKILIAQQPNFLYNLEGRYAELLDDWRLTHNNAIATPVKKFGLFMAFGSDNLPIDPRVGLYAAVTRKGSSGKAYGYEEEAVSIEEAIRMYTAAGPYLTREEKTKGTIEPGKLADMIVLDTDPLTTDPAKLLTTQVDLTFLGGKIVYDRTRASE